MNKLNAYVCPLLHTTVTTENGVGNSSFLVSCPKCLKKGVQELATSMMYKVDQSLIPTHEWYKPAFSELIALRSSSSESHFRLVHEHVKAGGLLLREIPKKGGK